MTGFQHVDMWWRTGVPGGGQVGLRRAPMKGGGGTSVLTLNLTTPRAMHSRTRWAGTPEAPCRTRPTCGGTAARMRRSRSRSSWGPAGGYLAVEVGHTPAQHTQPATMCRQRACTLRMAMPLMPLVCPASVDECGMYDCCPLRKYGGKVTSRAQDVMQMLTRHSPLRAAARGGMLLARA